MLGGYMGKMLLVDLTEGTIKEEPLQGEICRNFIGGHGLGVRILYERMKAGVAPLGAENWLGFVTGPLTGTGIPMSPRFTVVTKSPLTGTWGEANAGGYFGPELKAAGYDAIFISGVSSKPVYLLVHEGGGELKDAEHLWGKDTAETSDAIQHELGDSKVRVACIGPSGEKLSLISSIVVDKWRIAGRMGVGGVMGSKRLKAIAVRGTKKVPVANSASLASLRKDFLEGIKASSFMQSMREFGTPTFLVDNVKGGATPIKNWSLIGEEAMPSYSNLDYASVKKYRVRRHGCFGCPVGCGAIVSVNSGPYKVSEARNPEYESLASFGTLCLNDNVESIIKACDICNRYGMDTISVGSVIAFTMECFERGIIGKEELGGLELTWGNHRAIVDMVEKIGRREGFGDVLADGVKKAAERIGHGAEDWAIHVHGQEPGMLDPRLMPGRGIAYLADPTPGRHTQGTCMVSIERGISPWPDVVFRTPKLALRGEFSAKGPLYVLGTSYHQLYVSSGMCIFAQFGVAVPLVGFIAAVTGWDFSYSEGLTTGRRIYTARQAFNLREGLKPEEFRLPGRISQPASMGPYAGEAIDFDTLRDSFFNALNWDLQSGKPYPKELVDLHLEYLIDDLWG